MHNIDDYAWYEVGNQKYYNKIQALYDHLRYRLPLHWNVNDSDYDLYDWSIEPLESLESLYASRAQEIRAKYDYLVLHFSGGSDSGNILETFIKNNIYLDEILIRGSYSTVESKTGVTDASDQYGECLVQSLPLAQWAKNNHMPHVKINLVDTTAIVYKFFKHNPDWVEKSLWATTPSDIFKENIDLLDPEYTKMADRGIRVGHIIGMEKPTIFREKNFFYTKFLDKLYGSWLTVSGSNDIRPKYIEYFYWGKNAIPLQIKQLHVLKNYIKQNNLRNEDFDRSTGRAYERMVANVLYKRTMPLISEHEKDVLQGVFQSRDSWFLKDKNDDPFQNFYKGIEYLNVITDPTWVSGHNNLWKTNLKGIYSKPRFLGI